MPKQHRKIDIRPSREAPDSEPVATLWDSRIQPVLTKRAALFLVCFLILGVGRIIGTYSVFGPTQDEPATMACGVQFLARCFNGYHPATTTQVGADGIGQIARIATAVGPYLYGCRPLGNPVINEEGHKIMLHSGDPAFVLALMRMGILPFFVLAVLVLFLWVREDHGAAAAVCAAGILTLTPSMLAHAGLSTTDMTLTACLGAAFFALIRWARVPTLPRGLALGVAAGLAAAAKVTALGYLPLAAVFALAAYLAVERPGMKALAALAKARAGTFALAAGVAAVTIWAVYGFSWGPVPAWRLSLPAPEYFETIIAAIHHKNLGHETLLFGKFSMTGWWYFFPAVIAIKTPIAILLLAGAGCWYAWQHRTRPGIYLPLALLLGILLPAMTSKVNIGIRHILPVYFTISILAALGLIALTRSTKRPSHAAAAILVAWLAITGAINHPDYLPYFNELIADRESALADSDLEWGQDRLRLARRFQQLGVHEIHYGLTIDKLDDDYVWPGLPHSLPVSPIQPVEGWTVIHPSIDQMTQYGLFHRYPDIVPWWTKLPVTEKVGQYRLYYLPPGSIRRVR